MSPDMPTSLRVVPLLAALSISLLAGGVPAHAAGQAQTAQEWQAAIASPRRTDDDRKADDKRKPAEFLAFAQVKPGMKALDISAGGGSTATLLAAAVGTKGEVWAQNAMENAKLDARKVSNLHPFVAGFDNPLPPRAPALDLITINMSYHDIANTPANRDAMNKRLYDALKPGGKLVIIDNAAKKGSGLSATKTLHRIDEDSVVQEVTRAGFKLDTSSGYLRAPSDPREQPFFEMKGAPDDKFALRFVK
ncbi:MAG: methyltransferase [Oxalobacteraceae bacterium]|nr:MAG: methyltransferase [Oxalobacteraceae bacterium]